MIILVRHGETALNAARVLQPADTPLSERGQRQADAVAQRLSQIGFAAILSSDLPRAAQTAAAIAARASTAVEFSDELQERNFGLWRGRAYTTFDFDPAQTQATPPEGESIAQFNRRVARAMRVVVEKRAALSGNLVVVSHGLTLHVLLQLHALLPEGLRLPERLGNTSLTVITAEPPYNVSVLNSTDHLRGDLSDDARAAAV